jgi:hypothetical protein
MGEFDAPTGMPTVTVSPVALDVTRSPTPAVSLTTVTAAAWPPTRMGCCWTM